MAPLKKEQIKQEVFDLYDKYAHNQLDRRELMEKLSVYAVGGITMASNELCNAQLQRHAHCISQRP